MQLHRTIVTGFKEINYYDALEFDPGEMKIRYCREQ